MQQLRRENEELRQQLEAVERHFEELEQISMQGAQILERANQQMTQGGGQGWQPCLEGAEATQSGGQGGQPWSGARGERWDGEQWERGYEERRPALGEQPPLQPPLQPRRRSRRVPAEVSEALQETQETQLPCSRLGCKASAKQECTNRMCATCCQLQLERTGEKCDAHAAPKAEWPNSRNRKRGKASRIKHNAKRERCEGSE